MNDPSQAWIERLAELQAAGQPCAMIVVTAVRGSAPREVGARMLVADGKLAWGTIGGGNLERQAIEHASGLLGRSPGGPGGARPASESVAFPLAEKSGQCCGGEVTLFFEAFPWTRRTVAVFGAGHVGQKLGGLAPWIGADVLLIDGREEAEIQPPLPPEGERPYRLLLIDAPEAEIDELPPDALVVVMTHSHPLDLEVIARALRRGTFPYVGLIGSERKWQRFQKRLRERGFSAEEIGRVRCPIGVSRGAKEPAAIALSAATELAELVSAAARHGPASPGQAARPPVGPPGAPSRGSPSTP